MSRARLRRAVELLGGAVALLGMAAAVVTVAVATTPDPASAHGVGGIRPTNFETVITGMRPSVPGIDVRAVDLGDRLEVTNQTDRDLVVLGYDDEPYLRVGPRGTFENARSPATYVNRTRRGTTPVPDRADSDARPVWRHIGDEPVARWHDHRAHWTGRDDPPAVRADPDSEHVVQRFRVDLEQADREQAGRSIVVRGAVRWIPAPSAWLWIALALVLAAVVVALSRTSVARGVVTIALLAVIVGEALHVVGTWDATTLGTGTQLGANVYGIGAVTVALVALVWLWRRGLHAAAPLVLIAGLFVAIAGGLADVSVLTRSQLPTTLPNVVARATVAVARGLGGGLAVVGALRLRPERSRGRGDHTGGDDSWPAAQSWHSSSSVA